MPMFPKSGNRAPGLPRASTHSFLASLLNDPQERSVFRIAIPLLLIHGALLVVYDLAKHPYVTILLIVLAFLAYARAALRLENSTSTAAILCVAALLRLLLVPLPPTLSDDTLRYVWDGKVWNAGYNPYLLAPEAEELTPLRDDLWQRMPHREVQTVYPPLALATFTIASRFPLPLIGVKILLCFAEFLGCLLLIRLAKTINITPGRVIWYCWSPLATLEVAGMGHVDALGVLCMTATILALARKPQNSLIAAVGAAGGILAKLMPLIALPMWAKQSRRPVVFLLVSGLITATFLTPLVIAAGGPPPGLVKYGISWEFNGPLYEPLWHSLDHLQFPETVKSWLDHWKETTQAHEFWNRFYPYVYPQLLAKALLAAIFGLFFLRSWFERRPIEGTGRLFGGLMLCSATLYPWYLLWVLPFAALCRHRAWLVLSALVQISYIPQLLDLPHWPWFFAAVWVPFFLLLRKDRWSTD